MLLSPPDTRQQVPERDAQLDWSLAPCVRVQQRPPLAVLLVLDAAVTRSADAAVTRTQGAVLGAQHVSNEQMNFIVQPALEAW